MRLILYEGIKQLLASTTLVGLYNVSQTLRCKMFSAHSVKYTLSRRTEVYDSVIRRDI